jgi:hypothetical protein
MRMLRKLLVRRLLLRFTRVRRGEKHQERVVFKEVFGFISEGVLEYSYEFVVLESNHP